MLFLDLPVINLPGFLMMLLLFLSVFFFFKSNSLIYLLLVSELVWITLYASALISALVYNNLACLSLCFFFLMFSAAEISLGLIIFYVCIQTFNSLTLYNSRTSMRRLAV